MSQEGVCRLLSVPCVLQSGSSVFSSHTQSKKSTDSSANSRMPHPQQDPQREPDAKSASFDDSNN